MKKSTAKQWVILSPEDLDLKQFVNWHNNKGHMSLWMPGCERKVYLHRFIIKRMGIEIPEGCIVDHINRLTFDNRRENLRVVTYSENGINNDALGVSFHKLRKTWRAYAIRNYKQIHLGTFKTKEEALQARKTFLAEEIDGQTRDPN